jgi:RNA polymerase sigma-70 factor (ECF subfamily)
MTEKTISIEALKAGDREAYAAMVEEYSDQLYRLALRMVGNPQEAEDVLQETYLNAFKAIDRFEGRSSLGTWLYRIAANQALMRLRKNRPDFVSVDEPLPGKEGSLIPRQLKDWCCLPEKEFMSQESQEQLELAINMLSPALRAAFVLRDLHGLSTREAAEVLEISESAVKTRLLRARLELREQMSSYFGDRLESDGHE